MATKIVYEDKVALSTKSGIADKNKITASDMNAIKTSVNELIDESKDNNMFKNLFNVGNSKMSESSITFNNTNNQIQLNGSASNASANIFLDSPSANKDKEGIILKAGTYTATIRKISGSLTKNNITFYLRESNGTNIYNSNSIFTQSIEPGIANGATYSTTFTLTEETRLHWMGYFDVDAGHSIGCNNLVLQFQIEEGDLSTSYTPWTGYIVESGSNSNGNWIKYSDGTMICWGYYEKENIAIDRTFGSLYECQSFNLGDFSQNFAEIPRVTITKLGSVCAWIESLDNVTRSSLGTANWVRPTAGTYTLAYSYTAIGRWK